jgi:hypothetical protein
MTVSQRKQSHGIDPVKGDTTATTRVLSFVALPAVNSLCTSLSMPSFYEEKETASARRNIGKLVVHLV